ncbi:leucine efflux protein LeuE [Aquabacterium sp.]|uniref:leucine efflux protein LeuE n=1 Tax=Aquabacterium sp. TaxID=1872578 RepID=UPI003BAE52A0
MVYGITDLTTFVLGTIVIVLLPGPNSLYVMTVASQQGVAAGYRGALGIFTGDLILMSLAATGVASLFQANPALFVGLKYAGAAYLAFLGWGLLRAGIQRWRDPVVNVDAQPPTPSTSGQPFRVALLISLMNPKAILFFVSFFIQFVSPTYPHPWLSFLVLGTIVQVCSMVYLSALILGGSYLAAVFRRRRKLAALCTGSVGGLFIGFGARLAVAGLG